jgi:hypothetical protein
MFSKFEVINSANASAWLSVLLVCSRRILRQSDIVGNSATCYDNFDRPHEGTLVTEIKQCVQR